MSGRKTAFRKHGGQTQPVVDSTTGDVIHSQTLQQEFSLISLHNHPVYKIEKVGVSSHFCGMKKKNTFFILLQQGTKVFIALCKQKNKALFRFH